MLSLAILVMSLAPAPVEKPSMEEILLGTWNFNGNGYVTELKVTAAKDSKFEGTFYKFPCTGTYDAKTRQITIVRQHGLKDGKPFEVQEYTGTLTAVADTKPAEFKLAGTAKSLAGAFWGADGVEYKWEASAIRHQSPAQDLKEMQGEWKVAAVYDCMDKNVKLPEESRLLKGSDNLAIKGSELLWNGKKVATLANDVASKSLESEKGFTSYRLMMLTMPDGKAFICSYCVLKDHVEIAYPHTTACHRGSGQVISLQRPAK